MHFIVTTQCVSETHVGICQFIVVCSSNSQYLCLFHPVISEAVQFVCSSFPIQLSALQVAALVKDIHGSTILFNSYNTLFSAQHQLHPIYTSVLPWHYMYSSDILVYHTFLPYQL